MGLSVGVGAGGWHRPRRHRVPTSTASPSSQGWGWGGLPLVPPIPPHIPAPCSPSCPSGTGCWHFPNMQSRPWAQWASRRQYCPAGRAGRHSPKCSSQKCPRAQGLSGPHAVTWGHGGQSKGSGGGPSPSPRWARRSSLGRHENCAGVLGGEGARLRLGVGAWELGPHRGCFGGDKGVLGEDWGLRGF